MTHSNEEVVRWKMWKLRSLWSKLCANHSWCSPGTVAQPRLWLSTHAYDCTSEHWSLLVALTNFRRLFSSWEVNGPNVADTPSELWLGCSHLMSSSETCKGLRLGGTAGKHKTRRKAWTSLSLWWVNWQVFQLKQKWNL